MQAGAGCLAARGRKSLDSLFGELNVICVGPCFNTGFFHRSAPPSLGMVRSSMSSQAALLQVAEMFCMCLCVGLRRRSQRCPETAAALPVSVPAQ